MVQKEKSGIYLDSLVTPEMSDEDIDRARKIVASNSIDADDCKLLLEALDLL